MTSRSFNKSMKRNRVAIPYPLPEWIAADLDRHFELVSMTGSEPDLAGLTAMLTTGTHAVSSACLSRLPELSYICCIGSGYEGIETAYAFSREISISNSAIVTAEDVADQLVALTLASCCAIPALDQAIRSNRWRKPLRRSIRELKIGIFGLGAIGIATANRLAAFGPDIRWTGPRFKMTPFAYLDDLPSLADWADILLVAARADHSNVGLIDDAIFNRLGPEGLVVNVSRGMILREDQLIEALRSGRLGGAALDVFEIEPTPAERWADVPNIILSPHVGGYATGVRHGIKALVRDNLDAFFAKRPIRGLVAPSDAASPVWHVA